MTTILPQHALAHRITFSVTQLAEVSWVSSFRPVQEHTDTGCVDTLAVSALDFFPTLCADFTGMHHQACDLS